MAGARTGAEVAGSQHERGTSRVPPRPLPAGAEPENGRTGAVSREQWRRRFHDLGVPAGGYLAVASVLLATVWVSANLLRRNPGYPVQARARFLGDFLVEGWVRWDGGWYVAIARDGYAYQPGRMSSVAFFPAYPLAMRALAVVVPDPALILPGIVVTVACGLAATVGVHRWLRRVLDRAMPGETREPVAVARAGVAVLLLYPYAWFLYGAVYAEALFLLAAVGAFLLAERDRPVLAGLAGAVATASRPVGLGVVIGLVAVTLERRGVLTIVFLDRVRALGWRRAWREAGGRGLGHRLGRLAEVRVRLRRLRVRDTGVMASVGGLVAWMWYLRARFGDALLFVHVEAVPGWDQQPGPRTWLKISWLRDLRNLPVFAADLDAHFDRLTYTVGTTFQAMLVLGALCLVPAVVRRVGWGYATYVIGVVAIPLLGTKDWQGTGRYLLAAFPLLVVAGGWLVERGRRVRRGLLAASGLLLVFFTSAFARGFYLA